MNTSGNFSVLPFHLHQRDFTGVLETLILRIFVFDYTNLDATNGWLSTLVSNQADSILGGWEYPAQYETLTTG